MNRTPSLLIRVSPLLSSVGFRTMRGKGMFQLERLECEFVEDGKEGNWS